MKYKFQIQNCIDVEIEAENKDEARIKIIDNLTDYADELINNCYVSDGKKIDL